MRQLSETFVAECRRRLIETRSELINRSRTAMREFETRDRGGGDEADMTMSLMAENDFLTSQSRLKEQLLEIEFALARIELGSYGVCEITEEPIEIERLRALPWTRFSIEGAELREAHGRRYAR